MSDARARTHDLVDQAAHGRTALGASGRFLKR
jgi:hypothetical protein